MIIASRKYKIITILNRLILIIRLPHCANFDPAQCRVTARTLAPRTRASGNAPRMPTDPSDRWHPGEDGQGPCPEPSPPCPPAEQNAAADPVRARNSLYPPPRVAHPERLGRNQAVKPRSSRIRVILQQACWVYTNFQHWCEIRFLILEGRQYKRPIRELLSI